MRAEGLSYLGVSVEGGVVQGGPTAAVRHVYAAQHRDDELGTTQSLIGGGHVKRRLPVLVACVHVGRVTDQYEHRLLDKKKKETGVKKEPCRVYSRHARAELSFTKAIRKDVSTGV